MFEKESYPGPLMESTPNAATTEVVARPRRRHTLSYKLKVLETVAELRTQGSGAIGAYLRSEGLYYSTIRAWQRQQAEGKLTSGDGSSKKTSREELLAENKRLRRQNEQLEKRLQKTELIVELQKKLSQVLQIDQRNEESDEQ